jgi:hypothetical protein
LVGAMRLRRSEAATEVFSANENATAPPQRAALNHQQFRENVFVV